MIAGLRAHLAQRELVIEQLLERVAVLEGRLRKNSKNSSQPPASDNPYTKPAPVSLRKKTGRRPGKQAGEPGAWLELVEDPDHVQVHAPHRCAGCGSDLDDAEVIEERARQVFDLPPIRVEVTEHRAQTRRCRRVGCGRLSTGVFPPVASAPTCYGPRVAGLGTYLRARHHVPVDRTAELMSDCFGLPASTGWLAGLLPAAQARLDGPGGFTQVTRAHLRAAPVAHFDETGARVNGKLRWVHVASTGALTLYHQASARGSDAANLGGVLPAFTGTMVHDGLSSYRKYDVPHALCNAHHLRELVELDQTHQRRGITDITWPQDMIDLLVEINTAVTAAKTAGRPRLGRRRLANYQRRYRALIAEGWKAHPPPAPTGKSGPPKLGPAGSLVKRLDLYQTDVLRFATDFAVPFDNNQAERDIRMIRIQQKISGSWRTEAGADAFLTVRSYLATARKQHQNALQVLTDLFTGTPWLPAAT